MKLHFALLAAFALAAPAAVASPGASCNYIADIDKLFTDGPVCGAYASAPGNLVRTSATVACDSHPSGGTVAPCELQLYGCLPGEDPNHNVCTVQRHIPLLP